MKDGVVIGGPAHGATRDPERFGPVLIVPRPMRLREYGRYRDPSETEPTELRVEYKLHVFHATNGDERLRWRVWMPADVLPHKAFEFLIQTALSAPKPSEE